MELNNGRQEASTAGRVLSILLRSGSPVSGEEMGERLGCTRAAVGKAVEALRAQGFVIEARTKTGYQLLSEPSELLPVRVEARLAEGGLGLPFILFHEIDSTNLEARRRAEQGLPHGACLCAEIQTAGRGRLQRRWTAPRGSSLLFSLFLKPQMGLSEVFTLTNLMAVAVCEAVEGLGGPRCDLKWPNDVYLEGKKLAGILTEFTSCADRLEYVAVGTGINVNMTREDLSAIDAPAHSLLAATGRHWDRALLLTEIMNRATFLYKALCAGQKEDLTCRYNQRFWLAGKEVRVKEGEEVLTGRADGVASDGALVLVTHSGKRCLIRNGDVTVLAWG
jgi:BirA family biotin operon repressor/biotin-[acetyl-CoA-carboxylase] ligase